MSRSFKTIAVLEIVTGVGLILFWIVFFTIGLAPENPPVCYFEFEHSFPVPDLVLAVGLLVSGTLVLKRIPIGGRLSLACGGALLFLGMLDTSFNLQNGMYRISMTDTIGNVFINLWCMGSGAAILCLFLRDPAPSEKRLDNPL